MSRIDLHVGSIVDPIGAHAIVNASNPEVQLGSGVSASIRAACGGDAYQRELQEALKKQLDAALEPGDCLVTGAGRATAFRWVLHVPAVDHRTPDRQTGGSTGPARVYACFAEALEQAAKLAKAHDLRGSFVLATPVLGAGAGGLDAAVSLDAMMGALSDFLDERTEATRNDVARVVFVVLKEQDVEPVKLAAQRHGLGV